MKPSPKKPQIHWRIDLHETLSSTQEKLREHAQQGTPLGTVIQALSQTGGQGRQGRAWQSPPGNLYLSLLLSIGRRVASEAAFVMALSVYETAAFFKAPDLMLKWPNDILSDGKKLSGILIETQGDMLLIGIGLNVKTPPDIGVGLGDLDVAQVRDVLLDRISQFYTLWQEEGFGPVRALWLERAHKVGSLLKTGGIEGAFETIDHDGTLLLRDSQNKVHRITAGDVNLVIEQ